MSRARTVGGRLLAIAVCAGALGGCGSASRLVHRSTSHAATEVSRGVPAAKVRVIEGWSEALRGGHVAAAARYFRVPSVFSDGAGPPVELHSLAQVQSANTALPCGAKFLSARAEGSYVDVLFRLTNRPGPGGQHGCGSGTGETARTDFLIRDGRIVQWLRAPDEPGDNGSPRTGPSPSPATPSTNPGGATPIA